jgi:hypothetical protein
MQNKNFFTPEELELETALAHLLPAKTSIDRDLLMFNAGRQSVRNHTWMWHATAALLAVALTVSLATRPGTKPAEPNDYVLHDSTTATGTFTPSGPPIGQSKFSYIQIRNVILNQGLDALPMPEPLPANGDPLSRADFGKTASPPPVVILSVFAKDLASLVIEARCFASFNMTIWPVHMLLIENETLPNETNDKNSTFDQKGVQS